MIKSLIHLAANLAFVAGVLIVSSTTAYAFFHSEAPKRVVAAGGSITEIIYRLNEHERIVGVDSTSTFPWQAREKAQIGYVRKLSPEGVLSLSPDILIGEADTGPEKILHQLEEANLNIEILSDTDNLYGIEDKIIKVAQLLGVETKGKELAKSLQVDRQALVHITDQVEKKPKVLFVLALRNGQPIVSGDNTSGHEVLEAAGGNNLAANINGWKPLSTEAALSMNPDIIITMGRHGAERVDMLKELPHFKYSNAIKNNRVHVINGSYLLGMGPRTPQAVVELANIFHPDIALPALYELRYSPTANESE